MILPIVLGVSIVGLLAWELWICEGAHFGRRFVVWLYDLAAGRYDRIKHFDSDWERQVLGEPLSGLLGDLPGASLLDVGAGTGRTFRALGGPGPPQRLVGLEPSRSMLRLGRALVPEEVRWIQGWAVPLPLASESFDAVVCLEVTEFTPHPRSTITELRRVLRPGGWLLISNRIGWQAPLILGRTVGRRRFPGFLSGLGFTEVELVPWQVDYDMAWARKPWS
ncbi:MAG TPA: class I SAM-dependent methyltransferase [Anaerolineales bacterium]|nr:class I SAM-dependent methyltransferase [Anaerolineales bacterium]